MPATRATHNIEITAESLQDDLARLEVQKHALERELAAVVAHLDSVQRALSALSVLMAGESHTSSPTAVPSAAAEADQASAAKPAGERDSTAAEATGTGGRILSSSEDRRAHRQTGKRSAAKNSTARAQAQEQQTTYGRLTEQILGYFAEAGDADVRARDVAAALGRDTDSGSINAVRSTLDRLVATSRIERAGRGLYHAKR
ncbi:hypothetical protein [Streptomyces sp. CB02400]|uniref:hypothetical protein n=1 Tax=Streptomyces sp. CB02400 TaxID=1703944 RepID=UPI000ADAB03A|nr:hypothetical protein [Streptomyces sp. CB02400]